MQKKIEVTQRDINKGCQNSMNCCPIGRALRREFHCSFTDVSVGGDRIEVENRYMYTVPLKVQDFIEKFDSGKLVKPFSFVFKWETW